MIHNDFLNFALLVWGAESDRIGHIDRAHSGFWMRPVSGDVGFMGAFPWNPLNMRVLALHWLQWWRFKCALNAPSRRWLNGLCRLENTLFSFCSKERKARHGKSLSFPCRPLIGNGFLTFTFFRPIPRKESKSGLAWYVLSVGIHLCESQLLQRVNCQLWFTPSHWFWKDSVFIIKSSCFLNPNWITTRYLKILFVNIFNELLIFKYFTWSHLDNLIYALHLMVLATPRNQRPNSPPKTYFVTVTKPNQHTPGAGANLRSRSTPPTVNTFAPPGAR